MYNYFFEEIYKKTLIIALQNLRVNQACTREIDRN